MGRDSGSFYHILPSKEVLLLAVLDEYLNRLEPAVLRPAFAGYRATARNSTHRVPI
ncbi:MAG TPA: hypothetical protein VN924_23555 [Bryobacteraceae bacterium]|nr:hypothetical protein [Bryobacteraceae bacterium]